MKSVEHRAYRFVVALVLAGVCTACAEDSGSNATASSFEATDNVAANSVTAAPRPLPNRFANIDYPNATAHSWSGPEEMYQKTCAYCHGDHPAAGVGPELLGRALPAAYTVTIVRNGKMGMPGFRKTDFTDEQLTALANMIETSEAPEPLAPPMVPPHD